MRRAKLRHYLMCPPTYFDVAYSINPWMDPSRHVDRALAVRQWSGLVDAYRSTGHRVDLLEPLPNLPDMVLPRTAPPWWMGPRCRPDSPIQNARGSRRARGVASAERHLVRRRRCAAGNAINEAEGDFAVLSGESLPATASGQRRGSSRACHADWSRSDQP